MREFHAECVKILRARPLRRAGNPVFTAVLQIKLFGTGGARKISGLKLTAGAI
jgi:hypothetical protein